MAADLVRYRGHPTEVGLVQFNCFDEPFSRLDGVLYKLVVLSLRLVIRYSVVTDMGPVGGNRFGQPRPNASRRPILQRDGTARCRDLSTND